jgi:hypothetical protein
MGATLTYSGGANKLTVTPGGSIASDPHTLVGWCFPTSAANFNEQVEINLSGGGISVLAGGASGNNICWRMSDATFSAFTDLTSSPSLSTWHHVAGTYDGTTMRLYVDGVAGATATPGYGSRAGTWSQLAIGPYDGTVEFAHFYSAALSAQEIAMLFALKWPPRRTANLAASYPLYNGTALRLVDFSGNARNLALTGSAADAAVASPGQWMIPQVQYAQAASNIAITAAGGVQVSGAAAMSSGAALQASGSTLVSGAAAMQMAAQLAAGGLVSCNGVAIMSSNAPPTPSGAPPDYFGPMRRTVRPWRRSMGTP